MLAGALHVFTLNQHLVIRGFQDAFSSLRYARRLRAGLYSPLREGGGEVGALSISKDLKSKKERRVGSSSAIL